MIQFKRYFRGLIQRVKDCCIKRYIRFCGRPSRLKAAIFEAEQMHLITGRRYRVFFFGYRYHAWTREDIRRRLKSGLFREELKAGMDFDRICFFDTNNPDSHVCND